MNAYGLRRFGPRLKQDGSALTYPSGERVVEVPWHVESLWCGLHTTWSA
jgi:hypothetical protein